MTQKISKPGQYKNVPISLYHQQLTDGPSISSSGLRTIFKDSPEHYFDESYLNEHRAEPSETDASHFVLGRAAHHLLLGEEAFTTKFVVRPLEWDSWRGKEAKFWRGSQEKAGKTCLIPTQIEAIRGMAHQLAKQPLVQSGILNGQIEQTLVWKDKKTGIWIKSRPDAIPNASGDVADLKTTAAHGWDLDRTVEKHRYDMQAAVTRMAFREVLKRDMQSFNLVFVGAKRPHSTAVLTLKQADLDEAEKDVRSALDTFAYCLKTGNWFGPEGTQSDARFVYISERAHENNKFRREFLEREMKRGEIANQPTGAEYIAAG